MTTLVADTLSELATAVRNAWSATRRNQIAAWEGYLEVGDLLAQARVQFSADRDYGRWFAEQEFGFSTEWGRRLMRLAEKRPEVLEVLASALATGDRPPGVDVLFALVNPPQAHPHLASTSAPSPPPAAAYAPDHKRSAVVEIIVTYPFGVTKRVVGVAHGSGAERAEWHCEITMQQEIPADAIALGVFARELAMRFEQEVRQIPFLTMRP